MTSGGGCRTSIPTGSVTRANLYNVVPFENFVVRIQADGTFLWDMLNRILAKYNYNDATLQHGSFFQPSHNVYIEWDATAHAGARMQRMMIDGQPLHPNTTYTIITTDFLARGGDRYFDKALHPILDQYRVVLDSLVTFMADTTPTVNHDFAHRINEVSGLHKNHTDLVDVRVQPDPRPWGPDAW